MQIYPKRPHRPVPPIIHKSSLPAALPSGISAERRNGEAAHNFTSHGIMMQQENQAKINQHLQELHRNVATIVERIKEIQNKLGAVRSKAMSIRTVTKIRSVNRDE
jgi:phage-related tail protein